MLRFSKKLSGEKRAPSCASTRAALRKPLLARFIPPSSQPPPSPSSRCSARLRSALRAALGRTPKPRGRKEPSHGPKSSLRGGAGVGGSRGGEKERCALPPTVFSVRGAQRQARPPLRPLPSGQRRWENAVPTGRPDTRTHGRGSPRAGWSAAKPQKPQRLPLPKQCGAGLEALLLYGAVLRAGN